MCWRLLATLCTVLVWYSMSFPLSNTSVVRRRLLAMLCIVREELAELADRLPEWDEELNVAMDNRCQLLAPAALAFLQRLMTVPDPLQRCAASRSQALRA